MGDEVPDEGADDAPDPEPHEETEPSARADGDPVDPLEDTDNEDADAEDDPGSSDERAETAETTESAETTETGRDDAPQQRSEEPVVAEEGPKGEDETADETDGSADTPDTADDDSGDGIEIPSDYDPTQPQIDIDYGAQQYPSPADDEADEDGAADTDAEDGAADTDAEDGAADTDAEDGAADTDADEEPTTDDESDPATQTWEAEDSIPGAGQDISSAKSDGGYAGGTDTVTEAVPVGEYEAPTDDGELFEGPPDDHEMPLADHIEEMVRRLGVVIVVMAVVSGIVFPFGERIINFLWYTVLVSDPVPQPRVYHPLALILARLKVATLAGFIAALPVFVYESYLFMRPGLYPNERRYYLASVPTSLVLATVGVLFAYFLVLPGLFTYFLYYSDEVTVIAFGLTDTFDLMVLMLGGFALIFQIPLFVMLAIMMGLTTRQWMADRRLYFWGAFLGLAFLFSPDPTGMAPIIVAATMVALFEGTLFLLKWTDRGRRRIPGD